MKTKNFLNRIKILLIPVILFFILQLIFLPRAQQIKRLDREVRDLKQNIEDTYAAFGGEKGLKDAIIIRQAELSKLKTSFPREENISEVIKAISEQANRDDVLVKSVKPEEIKNFIDNKKYLPVRVFGQARYRQIGEFLRNLKETFNFLVTTEELKIEKAQNIEPELRFEALINIYVLI